VLKPDPPTRRIDETRRPLVGLAVHRRYATGNDVAVTENPYPDPNPNTPGQSAQPTPAAQYQQPVAAYQPAAPTEPLAIWALVCAIGSWVVLPVVLAIVGLVLAGQANRAIDLSGGAKSGKGMVTAAKVVAWINLGFYAVAVIFIIAFIIGIAMSSS